MSEMNRRTLLSGGAVAVGSLGVAGCASAPQASQAAGAPLPPGSEVVGVGGAGKGDLLDVTQPHLFDVARSPAKNYDGGQLFNANQETFPILRGQDVSGVLTKLQPGAVREPHWHPSAWEFHFVISGTARFSILEPEGHTEQFEASAGSAVFLPQGSFHYFENASPTEDYTAWLVFNTSAMEPRDDIGLVASLNVIPPDVLGAVFGVDPNVFAPVPKKVEPVTIVRKR